MSDPATVLVVEDDDAYRAELSGALHEHGYEVLEARSVPEAERLLGSNEVDVILLDLVLGDTEDGFRVLEVLREGSRQVPVIVLSRHIKDYVTSLANFYFPVRVLINKPCPVLQIVAHVAAALAEAPGTSS